MSLPIVVRAFIFNPLGQILMTKHRENTPWVLPGGHVEKDETIHTAILREIAEEFGISGKFFDIDNEETLYHNGKKLTHYPLPLSIYELHYTNTEGKDKSRIEYIFLMETEDTIGKVQTSEIAEYKWFEVDDILSMRIGTDIHDFTVQILEKIIGNDEDNE